VVGMWVVFVHAAWALKRRLDFVVLVRRAEVLNGQHITLQI